MAAAAVLTVSSCASQKQLPENGIALQFMDTSVRPQDDFFTYVNGNWVKTVEIPSDKASWGSFNELREKTDENSLAILNNILTEKYAEGTEGKKIQDLYSSFMNWDKRNADGINPIKADLAKIDAIKTVADLQKYLVEATPNGDNIFYMWRVGADLKASNDNAIYLGGPALGLGKDYYQKENEANTKTLAEYTKYVSSMLTVLGYQNANETAAKIVDLEKRLAKTLLTNEEGRDANKRYNPKTVSELSGLVKNVDLAGYLNQVGVKTDRVILGELGYFKNFDAFVNEANLPLLKDYMKYHMLSGNAGVLDKKLDDMRFDFYGKFLQGQKEQRAMIKR